ncbi:MAG: hypothetical protein ACYTEW_24540 [Planctomycetota bacterium]
MENTTGGVGETDGSGYPGNCYTDCHKVQSEHCGTVPCDECHNNFNKAPMHQVSIEPYDDDNPPDRTRCGSCHQATGDIDSTKHSIQAYTLDPPRIPNPQRHTGAVGDTWNRTNQRYWAENAQSCRYCHGSYAKHNASGLASPAGTVTEVTPNTTPPDWHG